MKYNTENYIAIGIDDAIKVLKSFRYAHKYLRGGCCGDESTQFGQPLTPKIRFEESLRIAHYMDWSKGGFVISDQHEDYSWVPVARIYELPNVKAWIDFTDGAVLFTFDDADYGHELEHEFAPLAKHLWAEMDKRYTRVEREVQKKKA